ncbi:MAG: hypothetical protein SOR31_03675 [Parvimonas sp.]|uniref:hypothetical protein n=1 Tax=Parvimonas sp. TaxID=1944660 RepID=UPI002A765A2E|nr:hypothetical protein [Parvimonas sp.]MDY3050716.1 hypothetical protein [Parvimonas sp.]
MRNFEEMKKDLKELMKDNYKEFVKSLISIEKGINDKKTLDFLYDKYIENDDFKLLNEEFEFLEDDMELEM